jgi:hypothetical protein
MHIFDPTSESGRTYSCHMAIDDVLYIISRSEEAEDRQFVDKKRLFTPVITLIEDSTAKSAQNFQVDR